MEKNNKKRLLCLIEILQKNTNENKHLSLNDIATLLEEKALVFQIEKLFMTTLKF